MRARAGWSLRAVLGIGGGALAVGMLILPPHRSSAQTISAPRVTLTDDQGRREPILGDPPRPTAVYFGYTHCTDSCPITLATLADARRRLGPAAREIRIAFVTVDPTRDTPQVLATYVHHFQDVIGFTGDPAQDRAALVSYHVWSQKRNAQRGTNDYLEAHSGAIFFIDATGRIRQIGDDSDTLPTIEAMMRMILPRS